MLWGAEDGWVPQPPKPPGTRSPQAAACGPVVCQKATGPRQAHSPRWDGGGRFLTARLEQLPDSKAQSSL